eukprot:7376277-Prymnesium_polylepis.2
MSAAALAALAAFAAAAAAFSRSTHSAYPSGSMSADSGGELRPLLLSLRDGLVRARANEADHLVVRQLRIHGNLGLGDGVHLEHIHIRTSIPEQLDALGLLLVISRLALVQPALAKASRRHDAALLVLVPAPAPTRLVDDAISHLLLVVPAITWVGALAEDLTSRLPRSRDADMTVECAGLEERESHRGGRDGDALGCRRSSDDCGGIGRLIIDELGDDVRARQWGISEAAMLVLAPADVHTRIRTDGGAERECVGELDRLCDAWA